MILGFKKQFVEPILEGRKIHTIREDSHDRWKPGNTIQFATGIRTKNYNCFKEGVCLGVQTIQIMHTIGTVTVYIDGSAFGSVFHHGLDDIYEYSNDLLDLAKNDGFEDLESFFKWFNKDFKGKLIHWTDFKY